MCGHFCIGFIIMLNNKSLKGFTSTFSINSVKENHKKTLPFFEFTLYCIKTEKSLKSDNFYQNVNEPQLDSFLQFRIECFIKTPDYFIIEICEREKIVKYMRKYINVSDFYDVGLAFLSWWKFNNCITFISNRCFIWSYNFIIFLLH